MSGCPEQWKLDVNERYQRVVTLVSGMAIAALGLPILFLKDISSPGTDHTIADVLSASVYWGWFFLGTSIFAAGIYQFASAKWVKLAWKQKADMFGFEVQNSCVERILDRSYALMVVMFVAGILAMGTFMITFKSPPRVATHQVQEPMHQPQTGSNPTAIGGRGEAASK